MQGGLSPPCNPPPQKPSSKVSRAVCKFCHFLKICHFCFYPDLPQKTWEEPCPGILGCFATIVKTSPQHGYEERSDK